MITRREFLKTGVACSALSVSAAGLGLSAVAGDSPPVKSKPDVILYRGSYPGWPWIASDKQGRLICVFRDGTEHGYSATGRAMMTTSTDGGKTWSTPTVIVDAPEIDDRNVAVAVLPNGQWLVRYTPASGSAAVPKPIEPIALATATSASSKPCSPGPSSAASCSP